MYNDTANRGKSDVKKKDIILIAVLTGAALLMYALISFGMKAPGSLVRITVDGELYEEYNLNEDREIEILTQYGENTLVIENGCAYMKEADCPDKYCINQGEIKNSGETIVCLPHRLVAEIISDDSSNNRTDIIAR